jgi:hypothetical protein
VALQLAASGVEQQRRGSADAELVVLGVGRCVRRTRHGPGGGANLVVADEERAMAPGLECAHAVVGDGDGRAVAHGLGDLGEGHVLEPGWEGEDLIAVLVGYAG